MLGFLHGVIVARLSVAASGGVHPMATGRPDGHCAVAMKLPNDQQEGADAAKGAVRGNEEMEPLFGDERWIEERLRVLQSRTRAGEGCAAA